MIGSKNQASVRPIALGATVANSTYGATIPVIFGRIKSALYLIWNQDLRQGSGGKKLKKIATLGKKGAPTYVERVDFLLGHNPIAGVLQFWQNQTTKLPLNFASYTLTIIDIFGGTFTIPDPNFYAILGVTFVLPYTVTFNDYGGTGPRTLSGTYECPLWNAAYQGPDPAGNSAYRQFPNYYYWAPGSGPSIKFDPYCTGNGDYKIYYARTNPNGSAVYGKSNADTPIPVAALRLTFEPVLGDGPEYSPDFTAQQILYPHYAGLGSPDFDLGTTQTMPDTRPEVLGTYPVWPTGDADFADMVEDIFKQGLSQAGLGSSPPFSTIQRGLNCYDYPGLVQQKLISGLATTVWPLSTNEDIATYDLPNTAGHFLICFASWDNLSMVTSPLTISDTDGNSWTDTLGPVNNIQCWYAQAVGNTALNTVTVGPSLGGNVIQFMSQFILEFAGLDTLDTVVETHGATGDTPTATITTSNAPGQPAFLLSICYTRFDTSAAPPISPLWSSTQRPSDQAVLAQNTRADFRTVNSPGTYTIEYPPPPTIGGKWQIILFAFKNSGPVPYPKSLGNILDDTTMVQVRNQCRAYGLYGSMLMDSQQKASEWLTGLYAAMVAAPVWCGFKLLSIPLAEISAAGNGSIFHAPTAAGPVANLTIADFIAAEGEAPVSVERMAQADTPNLLQLQIPSRASEYNDVVISQPETGSIAIYGPRKDSPKRMPMFTDPAVARGVLRSMIGAQNYINRIKYTFKLKAKWKLLVPMQDLITIPVAATMPTVAGVPATIATIPVRLNSIAEDADYNLDCVAEPFVYGAYAPTALPATEPQPYQPNALNPGRVNLPLFVEPPVRLTNQIPELWLVISGWSPNYGGCVVYLSTDGGNSYNSVGQITGSAITGECVGGWAANADPDTFNNLSLDLTESNGVLQSYQVVDEDNFVYPCFIGQPLGHRSFRILIKETATLTCYIAEISLRIVRGGSSVAANGLAFASSNTANAKFVFDNNPSTDWQATSALPQFIGYSFLTWVPLHAYAVADYIIDSAGHIQVVTFAGTSGTTTPTFSTTGGVTFDGSVVWQDTGVGNAPFPVLLEIAITNSAAHPTAAPTSFTVEFSDDGITWTSYRDFETTWPNSQETQVWTIPTDVTKPAFWEDPSYLGYELMSYAVATMTATNMYTLEANGIGHKLRRAVYGMPIPGQGQNHPDGSRFAFLGPQGPGILKLDMDAIWINKPLHFKFLAYNTMQGQMGSLSGAADYIYTPRGLAEQSDPNVVNYSQNPPFVLSYDLGTHEIVVDALTEEFPTNTAAYAGRRSGTITITKPIYVTIQDPNYAGDPDGTLPTQYIDQQTFCGKPGYVYVGSISPFNNDFLVTPGGWPPPQLFLVNGG